MPGRPTVADQGAAPKEAEAPAQEPEAPKAAPPVAPKNVLFKSRARSLRLELVAPKEIPNPITHRIDIVEQGVTVEFKNWSYLCKDMALAEALRGASVYASRQIWEAEKEVDDQRKVLQFRIDVLQAQQRGELPPEMPMEVRDVLVQQGPRTTRMVPIDGIVPLNTPLHQTIPVLEARYPGSTEPRH